MTNRRFNRTPFNANTSNLLKKAMQYFIANARVTSKRFNRAAFNRPITVVTSTITKGLEYVIAGVCLGLPLAYMITAGVAAKTKELAYSIKTTPDGLTKGAEYSIQSTAEAVQKGLLFIVHCTTPVVQLNLTYIVVNVGELSKVAQYSILVHKDALVADLTYSVLKAPIQRTRAASFNRTNFNRQIVSQSAALLSKGIKYYIRVTQAAIEKVAAYEILTVLSPTKVLDYCIRSTHEAVTKSLGYEILTTGGIAKGVLYYIRTILPATEKVLGYRILVPTTVTKSARYYIIRVATSVDSSAYFNRRHFNRPETTGTLAQKGLKYIIYGTATPITKGLFYLIRFPALTTELAYMITTSTVVQKALQYTIPSFPEELSKQVTYYIRRITPVLDTRDLAYMIQYPTLVTKTLHFIVYGTAGAITKDLWYLIRIPGPTLTKTVGYFIRFAHATPIQKAIAYIVQGTPGAIAKALEYRVRAVLLVHEPELWKQTVTRDPHVTFLSQVLVTYQTGMSPTFGDIRFGDDITGELYKVKVDFIIPSTFANFFVEVPDATQSTFTMYYGNTTLVVQTGTVDPVGAVSGTPSGVEVLNETFLYRYVVGGIA